MQAFGKLVRDRIPDIIRQQGETPVIKVLSDDQYSKELNKKLTEEVGEYLESRELDELADVLEVIDAICKARGTSMDGLQKIRAEKFKKRGGFSEKIFMVSKE